MLKLLIADDEPIVLKTMEKLLQEPEYEIDHIYTALNGEKAFSIFEAEHPDIIITDIQMPKMNGLELIAKIREEDESASIIIFSAYSEFEYARQAIRLNVVDYLLKPIHLPLFKNTMQKTLARIEHTHELLLESEQHPSYKKIIRDIMLYTQQHFNEEITLAGIAEQFFIDYHYLSKFFKKETGMLFSTYLTDLRMQEAKKLLQNPDAKIYEISTQIGYRDVKYFRQIFKKSESLTPSEYQQLSAQSPQSPP